MRTQVCITVDVEFNIAGAFGNPDKRPVAEPFVQCDVAGRSEGLGFLLTCFRKHHIPATFFIEALHRNYFCNDPMRPFVRRIRDEGHEVQLHVHPCWSIFKYPDWRERVRRDPKQDDFYRRSVESSVALIQEGIDTFQDWGMPFPKVFRSGSLQHDESLYLALARTGIPYSSNIGLAIFNSGDSRYQLFTGRHDIHGIIECPVLTFCDWSAMGRRHLRSLTISGTSFAETRTLLNKAHSVGIPLVVILTHPFEFVQSRDEDLRRARRHSVNQSRLTKLCEFLNKNRDRFSAAGLASAASAPLENIHSENPLLQGKLRQSLFRIATQVTYDSFGKLAPPRA